MKPFMFLMAYVKRIWNSLKEGWMNSWSDGSNIGSLVVDNGEDKLGKSQTEIWPFWVLELSNDIGIKSVDGCVGP